MMVASHAPPTGDLAHNPGMCPDWEWNLALQADTQSAETHQPGHIYSNLFFLKKQLPMNKRLVQ